jgi:hypothetical protein
MSNLVCHLYGPSIIRTREKHQDYMESEIKSGSLPKNKHRLSPHPGNHDSVLPASASVGAPASQRFGGDDVRSGASPIAFIDLILNAV